MPQTSHIPPPPRLSPTGHTEALLDRQLGLLTEALAERLALARRRARDPKEAFGSRQELEKALLVAAASADLVRAKARLRGEMQLRYHVVRLEGPAAARFAGTGPACESDIDTTDDPAFARLAGADDDAAIAHLVPSPPLPSLAEIAEAFDEEAEEVALDREEEPAAAAEDTGDGPGLGLPHVTLEELQSPEGNSRLMARWEAVIAAGIAARTAAPPVNPASTREAVPPPRDLLVGDDDEEDD